jgi:GNAT superfamily N-acetyltransferase
MSELEIRRFGPDDGEQMHAALELRNAVSAADSPWEHPHLPHAWDAMLRHGWDGEPATPYLLAADGHVVGYGSVSTSERDNRHLAWLDVMVHPVRRRQGYGTALLARMEQEARALGRTSVGIDGWDSEATRGFAARHRLEVKSREVNRRQHLAEVAPGVVQQLYDDAAAVAADYELVRIAGRTPDELMDAVVELSAAINDAPTDDLDIEDDVMSAERVEAYETSVLAHGERLYRLVARHRETGELGGHTVVAVEEARPALASQHDTAVARAHRGHRLGMLLKAGMLLWLAEAEPQVESVDTWNAESNDHMIAVNEALAYRVMGRALQLQKTLSVG